MLGEPEHSNVKHIPLHIVDGKKFAETLLPQLSEALWMHRMQEQLDLLDRLQDKLIPMVFADESQSLFALDRLISIMELRAKMLGFYEEPEKED